VGKGRTRGVRGMKGLGTLRSWEENCVTAGARGGQWGTGDFAGPNEERLGNVTTLWGEAHWWKGGTVWMEPTQGVDPGTKKVTYEGSNGQLEKKKKKNTGGQNKKTIAYKLREP